MLNCLQMANGCEIVFFDLETTFNPFDKSEKIAILEFASILVCPRRLIELQGYTYSTLIRPIDYPKLHQINRTNGITYEALVAAPTFKEVADNIYNILHGKTWAGHNIENFDYIHLQQAFKDIGRSPPKPKEIIDTLTWFRKEFENRATSSDMELQMDMAYLGTYFGLGEQTHRALEDVRMNLEVLRSCAAKLFLESKRPHIFKPCPFTNSEYLELTDVSLNLITVKRRKLLHDDVLLQLRCSGLEIIYEAHGISPIDQPHFDIIVDPPDSLCEILDYCDHLAQKKILKPRSKSKWENVLLEKFDFPAIRLYIEDIKSMEIYQKESFGELQKLEVDDAHVLANLLVKGNLIDVCFSPHIYENDYGAGIRLVAKMLVI